MPCERGSDDLPPTAGEDYLPGPGQRPGSVQQCCDRSGRHADRHRPLLHRGRRPGNSIFYFGVIFFALNLVSNQLKPLRNAPVFQEWLARREAVAWRADLHGIHRAGAIQQCHHRRGDSSGAAGNIAGRCGDSHCDGLQHRDHLDWTDGQPWDETNCMGHGRRESLF